MERSRGAGSWHHGTVLDGRRDLGPSGRDVVAVGLGLVDGRVVPPMAPRDRSTWMAFCLVHGVGAVSEAGPGRRSCSAATESRSPPSSVRSSGLVREAVTPLARML